MKKEDAGIVMPISNFIAARNLHSGTDYIIIVKDNYYEAAKINGR
jgi:hypothetical protein